MSNSKFQTLIGIHLDLGIWVLEFLLTSGSPPSGGGQLLKVLFTKFNSSFGINGIFTQCFFNTEQLVVLGHTVGTAGRTGFNLSAVEGHSQVGDGCIFSFTAAMAHDRRVAIGLRQLNGIDGFCYSTNLVYFNKDTVTETI